MQDIQSILKAITPHTNISKIFKSIDVTQHQSLLKSYLGSATNIPNHFIDTLIEKSNSETVLLLIDKLILLKKDPFQVSLIFEKFQLSQIQIRSILERENSAMYICNSVQESDIPFYYNILLNDNDSIVLRNASNVLLQIANKYKNSINITRLHQLLDKDQPL